MQAPPAPRPSAASTGAGCDDLYGRILGSFHGKIDPVDVSAPYRVSLFVVALAMVLLPLIYVGAILGVGYGVYYHATEHQRILEHDWSLWALLAYAVPLVAGAILIVFMIKPLFARRPQWVPRSLNREDEPLLFDYVEQVCRCVNAPLPTRIDVDCQLNASAGFRRGWRSFLGQDLVLTLGLPLVQGFKLQHHQLDEAAETSRFWPISLVCRVAQLMIWVTRQFVDANGWLTAMRLAKSLHEMGIKYSPEDFGLKKADVLLVIAERKRWQAVADQLEDSLAKFEAYAARRLQAALSLSENGTAGDIAQLLKTAVAFTVEGQRFGSLRNDYAALGMFLNMSQSSEYEEVIARSSDLAKRLQQNLRELREVWDKLPYPFEHAEASTTLGTFVVSTMPDAVDAAGIHALAGETLNRSEGLYPRVLGRLCFIAEGLEAEAGLKSLPEPEDPEERRSSG